MRWFPSSIPAGEAWCRHTQSERKFPNLYPNKSALHSTPRVDDILRSPWRHPSHSTIDDKKPDLHSPLQLEEQVLLEEKVLWKIFPGEKDNEAISAACRSTQTDRVQGKGHLQSFAPTTQR